jgi:soluble lytic murein transglycosylase-like protein
MVKSVNDGSGARVHGRGYRLRCAALLGMLVAALFPAIGYCAGDAPPTMSVPAVTGTEKVQALSAQDIASLLSRQFRVRLGESLRIGHAVIEAAKRQAMSPVLLLAVISVESGFNRNAVSVAGAVGLMQVLPSQHRDRVRQAGELLDADTNVSIGSSILHDYLRAADGDLHDALLRYSGGAKGYPARVAGRMHQIKVAFGMQSRVSSPATSADKY